MKFKELEIDNFLSVIHTKTNLSNRGLILVQGRNTDSEAFDSNGAGKSTIFSEAPCYALFGETIRGKKGDAVINTSSKKNCRVRLEIEADNKDIYEIIRHRKHKDHKNNVLLFRNGKNITGKSDTETNNMISDLLEIDFVTFTNSVLFGQGISKTFSEATDSEQKAILEKMLQIDIFKACQELAKKKVADAQKRIELISHDLLIQQNTEDTSVQEIEGLQRKEEELETKLEAKIQELRGELEGYVKELDELPSLEETKQDMLNLRSIVAKINASLEEYTKYETDKTELSANIKSLERDNSILDKGILSNEGKLEDIRTGKNIPKFCEACGQVIESGDTSDLEKHLEDSILDCRNTMEVNEADIKTFTGLLEKVNKKLEGKKTLETQKEELQQEINEYNSQIRAQEQQEKSLRLLVSKTQKQIEEQEAQIGTTYTEIINSKVADLDELRDAISNNNMAKEQEEQYLEKVNFWATDGFGNKGIKSKLLDSVTPYLNQQANHYLSQLTDGSIEIMFDTQAELKSGDKKDKFTINISNKNGDNDYKGNSGGEKKRIDIAINMALQDLMQSRSNKNIDIIVYDEVFESLDEVGSEIVIQLLQEKARTCGTVIVITHNYELKKLFTKSLVVSKESGETTIYEESV